MKKIASLSVRCSILVAVLVAAVSCTEAPAPTDPAYAAEIDEWRNARLARLTADDGWLSLTGLYWLEPGENRFGSAEDGAVVLPDPSVPDIAGMMILGPDGTVIVFAEEDAGVQINGEPLTETTLRTDAEGSPDIVTAGRIRFYIIDRGGRLAARVKDPEAPTRLAFEGIEYFSIDSAYRVEARFEPYEAPREVAIPTVLGEDSIRIAPGILRFTIDGTQHTLEPYLSGPENEQYFLIFRDATSAVMTYGAGRYLYAAAAGEDSTTVLDFNLAYNPPCAFTPYATCPLPPPQNWLQVSIKAGERYSGEEH